LSVPRPVPAERRPVEPTVADDGAFRAGFVALVGRPNVGKSTLLNRLLGQKLAPTTHKPQTTRKNLLGILNPSDAQICLLDTPGHHRAQGPLNRFMVSQAEQAIMDADVIGYVVEARPHGRITPGNERILQLLRRVRKPVVIAVNKIDRITDKTMLLAQLKAYADALSDQAKAVVPVSARRSSGLDRLVVELGRALPIGERLFDEETLTDQNERSLAAELIREKVMLELQQELPYAATVTIDDWSDDDQRTVVSATIHVERQAQKGIVIGRGGERLRAIGIRARHELEGLLERHVYLDLHVKVSRDWSQNAARLENLGYTARADDQGAGVPAEIQALLAALQQEDEP
jgi:GTP-binding protein Era